MLEHVYPALLTTEQTPQQVEILVPLGCEWAPGEEEEGGVDVPSLPADSSPSVNIPQPPSSFSPHSQLNGSLRKNGTKGEPSILSSQSAPGSMSVGSPASPATSSDHTSWEVLSKQSTASHRLSVIPDMSSRRSVVPLWECIQEAFKTPLIVVNGSKLLLPRVIPDLLFADLPSELIFWSKVGGRGEEELLSSLGGAHLPPPSKELSGLFVRQYYTSKQEDFCVRQPAGALKAVSGVLFFLSVVHEPSPPPPQ